VCYDSRDFESVFMAATELKAQPDHTIVLGSTAFDIGMYHRSTAPA
jgi:hypothetical protein